MIINKANYIIVTLSIPKRMHFGKSIIPKLSDRFIFLQFWFSKRRASLHLSRFFNWSQPMFIHGENHGVSLVFYNGRWTWAFSSWGKILLDLGPDWNA